MLLWYHYHMKLGSLILAAQCCTIITACDKSPSTEPDSNSTSNTEDDSSDESGLTTDLSTTWETTTEENDSSLSTSETTDNNSNHEELAGIVAGVEVIVKDISGANVFFRKEAIDESPQEGFRGIYQLHNNCLFLQLSATSDTYLLVWPANFDDKANEAVTLATNNDSTEVTIGGNDALPEDILDHSNIPVDCGKVERAIFMSRD